MIAHQQLRQRVLVRGERGSVIQQWGREGGGAPREGPLHSGSITPWTKLGIFLAPGDGEEFLKGRAFGGWVERKTVSSSANDTGSRGLGLTTMGESLHFDEDLQGHRDVAYDCFCPSASFTHAYAYQELSQGH